MLLAILWIIYGIGIGACLVLGRCRWDDRTPVWVDVLVAVFWPPVLAACFVWSQYEGRRDKKALYAYIAKENVRRAALGLGEG